MAPIPFSDPCTPSHYHDEMTFFFENFIILDIKSPPHKREKERRGIAPGEERVKGTLTCHRHGPVEEHDWNFRPAHSWGS